MGLDINVIVDLKKVGKEEAVNEWDECDGGYFRLYVNPDFPGRADLIEHAAYYSGTEVHSFRAGSYGGYNSWREQLAKIAGYPSTKFFDSFLERERECHAAAAWVDDDETVKKLPLYELICFSDCEGIIDSSVCRKLYKEMSELHDKAKLSFDNYGISVFEEFLKAFQLASEDLSVVEFC